MLEWFYSNETLVWWLFALSFVSLLVTLITIPVILVRLPRDYFSSPDRHHVPWNSRNRFLRIPIYLAKNLSGAIFVLAGVLMLALPGQGLLTIAIGLVLMDFPGKYHAEGWIVRRPSVLTAINWIRVKAGKQKFSIALKDEPDHGA